MFTVNTHTYSRVHSDIFLLKSTVSTDYDSPPVFHWNVKHTHVSSSLLLNWSAVFLSFHMFKWPFTVLLQAPHILGFQCWLQLWVSQHGCVKYGIYVTYITTKGEMTQNHQNSGAVFGMMGVFIYLFIFLDTKQSNKTAVVPFVSPKMARSYQGKRRNTCGVSCEVALAARGPLWVWLGLEKFEGVSTLLCSSTCLE